MNKEVKHTPQEILLKHGCYCADREWHISDSKINQVFKDYAKQQISSLQEETDSLKEQLQQAQEENERLKLQSGDQDYIVTYLHSEVERLREALNELRSQTGNFGWQIINKALQPTKDNL